MDLFSLAEMENSDSILNGMRVCLDVTERYNWSDFTVERTDSDVEWTDYFVERSSRRLERTDLERNDYGTKRPDKSQKKHVNLPYSLNLCKA